MSSLGITMFLEIIYGFVSLSEGCLGWCWSFIINISEEYLHISDLYSRGCDTTFWEVPYVICPHRHHLHSLLALGHRVSFRVLHSCSHCFNLGSSVGNDWSEIETQWTSWSWVGLGWSLLSKTETLLMIRVHMYWRLSANISLLFSTFIFHQEPMA